MVTKKRTRLKKSDMMRKFGIDLSYADEIAKFIENGEPVSPGGKKLVDFLLSARSEWEYRWSCVGRELIGSRFGAGVIFAGYEYISFRVPGGSYTPDFFYVLSDGRCVLCEIKASKHQSGYAYARAKLRAAASLNPWFVFVEARMESKEWAIEVIEADISMVDNIKALGDKIVGGGCDEREHSVGEREQ